MPLKERNPWYENALLIAVAGSIIVVIGQLAGTVIPIKYGAEDVSDFSVSLSSNWVKVINSNKLKEPITVTVEDLHPSLRPYKYGIYLRALQMPPGINVTLQPLLIRPGETSKMDISFSSDLKGDFPIIIQGMGGNGKSRNTTFYLELL